MHERYTPKGRLTGMVEGFMLNSNKLTGSIPFELGRLSLMTAYFALADNELLCETVPFWPSDR